MRLPNPTRLLVLFLLAAVAIYVANAGLAAPLAGDGDSASHEDEAPSLESLTERIADLENRIAELEVNQDELAAQGLAYPLFDTIAAVYLLDQIDIHALHMRLKDGEGIMPGDSGRIRRLVPLLSVVVWPQELAEEGTALVETLTQLSAALSDDDLDSAVPLASAAHEAQHHLSGNVADWFKRTQMPEEDPDQEGQSEAADDDHGHSDDGDGDAADHGHSDDEDGHSGDDDHGDDDDSDDNHDDGHDHSHGG